MTEIQQIALNHIVRDVTNPRRAMNTEELEALADSIGEVGIIEPLIVRRKGSGYTIVAGERRWSAAHMCEMTTVPCIVVDGAMADMAAIRMAENMLRADLSPIEAAEGYRQMQALGMAQAAIGRACGKSQPAVANALRLLTLPTEVQDLINSGELTAGHGMELARIAEYPEVCTQEALAAVKYHTPVGTLRFSISYRLKRREVPTTAPPEPVEPVAPPAVAPIETPASAPGGTRNEVEAPEQPETATASDEAARRFQTDLRRRNGWLVSESDLVTIIAEAFYRGYLTASPRSEMSNEQWQRANYPLIGNLLSEYKPSLDRYKPAPIDTKVNNVTNAKPSPPPAPSPAAPPPPAPEPPSPFAYDPVHAILHNIDARLTSVKEEADRLPYTQLRQTIAAAIRACRTIVAGRRACSAPIDTNVNTVNNVKPSAVDVAVPAAVPAPWQPAVGDIIRMVGRPGIRARIRGISRTTASDRIAADIIGLTSGKLATIHPDDWAQWELNPEVDA